MPDTIGFDVNIRGDRANLSLKALTGHLRSADEANKKLLTALERTDNSLDKTGKAGKRAADGVNKYKKAALGAGKVGIAAFKGIGGAVMKTSHQILSATKYLAAFSGLTGGLIAGKAMSDLVSFTEQFGLLNATLGAQLPKTLDNIKTQLMEMARTTGKTVDELTDSMTQLFSSGLAPTAQEGTRAYEDQLQNVIDIQERLALSAQATGETVEGISKSYVFAANAMGLNVGEIETANYMMDLFAATLDTGIGTMDEYSAQFVKFAKEAKQAGASDAEMMGVFSRMTKTMNPNMAGFTTQNLFKFLNKLPDQARQSGAKVKAALKAMDLTEAERSALGGLGTTEDWGKIFYSEDIDENGLRMKRSLMDIIGEIRKVSQSGPQGTVLADILLGAVTQNARAKKALADVISEEGFEDLKSIVANIENATGAHVVAAKARQTSMGEIDEMRKKDLISETQYQKQKMKIEEEFQEASGKATKAGLMDRKIEEMMASFSKKWAQFKQVITTSMLDVTMDMSPALGMVLEVLSAAMSGSKVAGASMTDAFDSAREALQKTHPAFIPVVDALQKIAEFINSGDAAAVLGDIADAFKMIGTFAGHALDAFNYLYESDPVKWLRKLTNDNLVANIFLGLTGYNALKAGITSLAGSFMSLIVGGSSSGKWKGVAKILAGAGVWGVAGGAFAAVAVAGIRLYLDDKIGKLQAMADRARPSGDAQIAAAKLMKGGVTAYNTLDEVGAARAETEKKSKFKFGSMDRGIALEIAESMPEDFWDFAVATGSTKKNKKNVALRYLNQGLGLDQEQSYEDLVRKTGSEESANRLIKAMWSAIAKDFESGGSTGLLATNSGENQEAANDLYAASMNVKKGGGLASAKKIWDIAEPVAALRDELTIAMMDNDKEKFLEVQDQIVKMTQGTSIGNIAPTDIEYMSSKGALDTISKKLAGAERGRKLFTAREGKGEDVSVEKGQLEQNIADWTKQQGILEKSVAFFEDNGMVEAQVMQLTEAQTQTALIQKTNEILEKVANKGNWWEQGAGVGAGTSDQGMSIATSEAGSMGIPGISNALSFNTE